MRKNFALSVLLNPLLLVIFSPAVPGADCNGNGIDDAEDILEQRSQDCNANGVPDECDLRPGFQLGPEIKFDVTDRPYTIRIQPADFDLDGHEDLAVFYTDAAPPSPHGLIILWNEGSDAVGIWQGFSDATVVDDRFYSGYWLGSADLDGDARPDLAVHDNRTLKIYWNESARTFSGPWSHAPFDGVLVHPAGNVELADLTGDGRPDLIAPHYSSPTVRVARNEGNRNFDDTFPSTVIGTNWTLGSIWIKATDLDADGDLDLAVSQKDTDLSLVEDYVSLVINDGAGNLSLAFEVRVGLDPSVISAGDFDKDGFPDLIVMNRRSDELVILRNRGRDPGGNWLGCELKSRLAVPVDSIDGQVGMHTADVDGDGNLDLLVTSRALNIVHVLLGSGDLTFGSVRDFDIQLGPVSVACADLDEDGDSDVITGNRGTGDISVRLAHLSPTSLDSDGNGVPDECKNDCNGNGVEDSEDITAERSKDCNANGIPDECDLKPVISLGPARVHAVGFEPDCIAAADLDGDGRPDLVTANWLADSLTVLRNATGFEDAISVADVCDGPTSLVAADFDRDGKVDLAVACQFGDRIAVLMNKGGGVFAPGKPITVGRLPLQVRAGDVDGDLDIDLVVSLVGEAYLSVLLNDGAGDFTEVRQAAPVGLYALALGDYNGDGYPDLAVADVQESHVIFIRNGGRAGGTWRGFSFVGPGPVTTPSIITGSLAWGDLDQDGDLDLVAARSGILDSPAGVSVIWNHGGEGFALGPDLVAGAQPVFALPVDLDGDALTDLSVCNQRSGSISVFRNQGGGAFGPIENFPAGPGTFTAAAADFDQDGRMDIATANRYANTISLFQNFSSPPRSADCNLNLVLDECDIASGTSEDLDMDGVPDDCGGHRLPGDANGDGGLDISDAVATLGFLFLGTPKQLPCGEGSATDPGPANVKLIDWQPDGAIDVSDAVAMLSFLFLGGHPHTLAIRGAETKSCVPIVGCPDLCGQ